MGKSVRKHPITDKEMAFAHLVLKNEPGMTDAKAAVATGFAAGQGPHLKRKACVREYMQQYQAGVREKLEQCEADSLIAAGITREAVLKKLWGWVCIDPALTGYDISGQRGAMRDTREMLGMLGPEQQQLSRETVEPLPRAKWQDEMEQRKPN